MSPTLEAVSNHQRHDSGTSSAMKLPKKLIICCDGTWMNSDNGWVKGSWGNPGHPQNPSNVTRIARAVKNEDDGHHQQIVYYQAGIGTGLGLTNHLVGGGTGLGLSESIREAYAFLASNYSVQDRLTPTDSIFLIGFSRGAFTARSLGGFIGAVGILTKKGMPHFYSIFEDWENAGSEHYKPQFFDSYFSVERDVKKIKPNEKLAHKMDTIDEYMSDYRTKLLELGLTQIAKVKCIGVWDTVGALGIPTNPALQKIFPGLPSFFRSYRWFDTTLDNCIENAFHALALDENRSPYSPAVWEKPEGCKTNLKQVWFPGVHSNVGGSYSDTGMADVTIAWMMDQLAGHSQPREEEFDPLDWIKFDQDYLDYWYESELKEYKKCGTFRGWGLGKVYDSFTFPQSLLGRRTRSPGRYHRTDYKTGNEIDNALLCNTHEYIHSSVRVRMELAGLAREPDWSSAIFKGGFDLSPWLQWLYIKATHGKWPTYKPQEKGAPLHGWRLDDGHLQHEEPNGTIEHNGKPITWTWEGKGKVDRATLYEDHLGPFERQLLQKDEKISKQVEVSNGGFVQRVKKAMDDLRHAHTI